MQNQTFNIISYVINILELTAKIFWFVVPIVMAIWYSFYVLRVRKRVEKKEGEIFTVKKEIDNMLNTVHKKRAGYINQSQLEAITEKERIPLRAKFETLKMERQFLLDKISILNLIKKIIIK